MAMKMIHFGNKWQLKWYVSLSDGFPETTFPFVFTLLTIDHFILIQHYLLQIENIWRLWHQTLKHWVLQSYHNVVLVKYVMKKCDVLFRDFISIPCSLYPN